MYKRTSALIGCALLLSSGCTAMKYPRSVEDMAVFDHCEDVDCIVEVYDDVITGSESTQGKRWSWMEGYRDTPLQYMLDNGNLTISEIHPLWLVPQAALGGMFVLGYASINEGETGDVSSCNAHYMPLAGLWKKILVHELMHCQGYMEASKWDIGAYLVNLQDHYTPKQEMIMEEEGVESWTETSFYQMEDNFWHDR